MKNAREKDILPYQVLRTVALHKRYAAICLLKIYCTTNEIGPSRLFVDSHHTCRLVVSEVSIYKTKKKITIEVIALAYSIHSSLPFLSVAVYHYHHRESKCMMVGTTYTCMLHFRVCVAYLNHVHCKN